ncbi:nitroreductase/quinone reductase family protein [Microlunatus sp. GCM10028923]|uniref:nitroreductase/quinone reductase family protein n=1 Tax=Microlunatus sp. GCM10028923 TaxID=3273400 RepID=UPI00361B063E
MPTAKTLPRQAVDRFNAFILGLRDSSLLGPWLRRSLTIVTYTGRRSGRTFSTPVGFRRDGDTVIIGVMMPERKKWWRNFLGEGGPIMIELDGTTRTGHAIAERDSQGRVSVTVRL